jgi:hypothetical protein
LAILAGEVLHGADSLCLPLLKQRWDPKRRAHAGSVYCPWTRQG